MVEDIFKNVKKGEWLFVGILLLFFVTDALNVIIFHGAFDDLITITKYTKLSAYSKFLFLSAYLVYLLIKEIRLLIWGALFLIFFFSFPILIYGISVDVIFTLLLRFSKLLLPVLLLDFLIRLRTDRTGIVFSIYKILLLVQVVIVILAFVFNWDIFRTYGGVRFGYSGLLYAQNEATFYYVIAAVFVFKLWEDTKNRNYLLLLGFVLLAAVLLGTKAVFLFLGSFIIFLGLYYRLYKKLYSWIAGFVGVLLVVLFLYNAGIIEYYLNQANEEGWLFMITSKRNVLIAERLPEVFGNWHWYNYLFGGVNPATSFVEMDLIDLFLFGGIIGSALYYILLFKTIFKFSKNNYIGWFLVSQYFLIGGLAGHVFASGINAIYLALTSYYLQRSDELPPPTPTKGG